MSNQIEIPYNFTPREYQVPFLDAMECGYKRAVTEWHRRSGKDKTFINFTAKQMTQRVGLYAYLFPTYKQARKVIWNGMDKDGFKFMDHFPEELRIKTNNTDMSVTIYNNSIFQLFGTDDIDDFMGTNPVGCVFSEYSLQVEGAFAHVRPILRENGGWAVFNFTPRGRGHAWRLANMAAGNKYWFYQKLTVDDTKKPDGTPVVTPEDIQQDRDEGMSEPMIQQEYFCFPAKTQIKTDTGHKSIEDIRSDDVVLSHSGRWRRVTSIMSRNYSGDMVYILTNGRHKPLICTPNHPIRILNRTEQQYRWVPARYVKKHDFMVMPRLKIGTKVVSKEIITLLAWYITEGSSAKTAVQFTLSKEEAEEYESIIRAARQFDKKIHILTNNENAVNIIVNSTQLSDFLICNCGTLSHNKRIPFSLIRGYEKEFLDLLIAGDGCVGRYSGVTMLYTTVSEGLAYDVQLLASSIGYRASVDRRPGGPQKILGRTINARESFNVRISGVPTRDRKCARISPAKHGVGIRVRSNTTKPYTGTVYNFSVQYDESYIADGCVVHNCSSDAQLETCFFGDVLDRHVQYESGIRGDLDSFKLDWSAKTRTDEIKFEPNSKGILEIWGLPYRFTKGWNQIRWTKRYSIGGDIGEGLKQDYSVAYVFDRHTNKLVARMRSNTIDAHQWADYMDQLSLFYDGAILVPERTGAGITTCKRLWDLKSNVYYNMTPAKSGKTMTRIVGWVETKQAKWDMAGDFREYLKTPNIFVQDAILLQECSVFVIKENKKLEAEEGFSDDCVIAACLAIQGSYYLRESSKPTGEQELKEKKHRAKLDELDGVSKVAAKELEHLIKEAQDIENLFV